MSKVKQVGSVQLICDAAGALRVHGSSIAVLIRLTTGY